MAAAVFALAVCMVIICGTAGDSQAESDVLYDYVETPNGGISTTVYTQDGTYVINQFMSPYEDQFVKEYDGPKYDFIESEYYKDYDLIGIDDSVFENCKGLRHVDLGGTLCKIGEGAFRGCIGMETLTGLNSTKIENYAFYGCESLRELEFEVTELLGMASFEGCTSLESVVVGQPGDVNEVSSYADVFKDCTSLRTVTDYCLRCWAPYSFQGCTALTDITSSVKDVDSDAFAGCTSLKHVVFGSIGIISDGAFDFGKDIQLETAVLGGPIWEVPNGLFQDQASLKSVIMPLSSNLGVDCFKNCVSLTHLEMDSVEKTRHGTFEGCTSLSEFNFPSLKAVSYMSFAYCGFTGEVVIPSTVTELYGGAFYGSEGITSFGVEEGSPYYAEDGVLYSGDELVCYPPGALAESFTVPLHVTSIGDMAFSGHTILKEVIMNDGVKSISRSFEDCTGLEFVSIPSSVNVIDSFAFHGITFYDGDTVISDVYDLPGYAYSGSDGKMYRQNTAYQTAVQFVDDKGKPLYRLQGTAGSPIDLDLGDLIPRGSIFLGLMDHADRPVELRMMPYGDIEVTVSMEDDPAYNATLLAIAALIILTALGGGFLISRSR